MNTDDLYRTNCLLNVLGTEAYLTNRILTSQPVPTTGEKRIWKRIASGTEEIGVSSVYVSSDPPECRLEQPNGPDDFVVEGTLGSEQYAAVRTQCLQEIREADRGKNEFRKSLIDRAEARLQAESEPDADDLVERTLTLVQDDSIDGDSVVGRLYSEYFENFEISADHFTFLLPMAQIQIGTGNYLMSSTRPGSPSAALYVYLRWCALEWKEIPEVATSVANSHYDFGNERILLALESPTFHDFYLYLYLAAFNFLTAMRLQQFFEELDTLDASSLTYDRIRAEEGFACTMVGLNTSVAEMLESSADCVRQASNAIQQSRADDAREWLFRSSRPTNPRWPEFFTELLWARSMTQAGSSHAHVAIDVLQALHEKLPDLQLTSPDRIESDNILLSLSKAFGAIGDTTQEEAVRRYLAGQMVVRLALNKSG